jgi:hypothetical protein
MLRAACLCLIVSFASFALAQNTDSHEFSAAQSAPVQVIYVVDGTSVVTYNVDPQSLNPIQVGNPLPLSVVSGYYSLVSSPNGRFLYVFSYAAGSNERLWVYDTGASGVPQVPAVQVINAKGLIDLAIDRNTGFLYAIYELPNANSEYMNYTISRFLVNPMTGAISQRLLEAKYKLPSGAGGSEQCGVLIFGFNGAGTKLYDAVFCSYHGGVSATYNERSVNLQTGALGLDVQIYGWNNSSGGGERVQFIGDLMFVSASPNYQQGLNSFNIYPLKPGTNTPIVNCTASMLEACGYSSGVANPSGKYIFMGISQNSTQIEKVELSEKKIVATPNYIPYSISGFSPDGTLVYSDSYSWDGSYYDLEIYGFDLTTSDVTPGGYINVPSTDYYFVAERY